MTLLPKFVSIVVVAVALASGGPARPEDLPVNVISVRYLLDVDGLPQQKGESFCRLHQECLLGFDYDRVQVTITLGTQASEDSISISCAKLDLHCTLVDTLPQPPFCKAGLRDFDVLAWKGGLTFGAGETYKFGSLVLQVRASQRISRLPGTATHA